MYSKEYLDFIKWCKDNDVKLGLTGTQSEFVQTVLKENDKIGDFRHLIEALAKYLNK